jgi:Hemerythrin HHE cation binding domain
VVPDVRERVLAERSGTPSESSAGSYSLGEVISGSDSAAAELAGEVKLEREGNWGDAGGLPVADRPRAVRSEKVSAAGGSGTRGAANPAARDNHRNLVAIHDHLRSELEQIGQAVSRNAAGELAPAAARSLIARMTLRQNHWTLGSFCASYCRIVTIHHAVEDTHMFPALSAAAPSLQPVLDRLEAEHLVIAGVLERFDRALVDLVREDEETTVPIRAGTDEIGDLATELGEILLSHLAYEEDELIEGVALMPSSI